MKLKVWLLLLIMCALVLFLSMDSPPASHALSDLEFTITITIDPPEGGYAVIDPQQDSYSIFDWVYVSANRNPGWRFSHWSGDDANWCANNRKQTMISDISCTAHFKNNFYVLITTEPRDSDNRVEISPPMDWSGFPLSMPSGYAPGTIVTLDTIAQDFHYFDSWIGPNADECAATELMIFDHHINCTAVFSPQVPPPPGFHRWMTDNASYIEDRRLIDVVLPGSHDAGTYSFSRSAEWVAPEQGWEIAEALLPLIGKVHKDKAVDWAKTQSGNLQWQLDVGMRYLDLRFMQRGNNLYIHHGQLRGTNNSDEILAQVQNFLSDESKAHEKEIIILDFTRWTDVDEEHYREFLDDLLKLFKDKMIPAAYEHATLGEIWALPGQPQLVVRFLGLQESWFNDNDRYVNTGVEDFQLFWPQYPSDKLDTFMCRPWADAQSIPVLNSYLARELVCPCCADGNDRSEQFFVLQGQFNADAAGESIKCGIRKEVDDWLRDFKWFCDIPVVGSETCSAIDYWIGLLGCPVKADWENAPKSLFQMAIGSTDPGDGTPRTIGLVSDWWDNCQYCTRDNLNIITVDFLEADNVDLVREAIKINQLYHYNDTPTFISLPDLDSKEGDVVQLSAGFNDESCDHHIASIDWGDGTGPENAAVDKERGLYL